MNDGLQRPKPALSIPCVMSAMLFAAACLSIRVSQADQPQNDGRTKAVIAADHAEKFRKGTVLFQENVRAILTSHCLKCHGGESVKADFDLSTRSALMESGHVAKTASDSHLFHVINHTAEPVMPLKAAKLSDDAIELVRRWIDLGAPYDKPLVKGEKTDEPMRVKEADRNFWSFLPLTDVPVPTVEHEQWCRTPVDRFILARQEASGLSPNSDADARTLIRRGAFDLLGLPATPEQVKKNAGRLNDESWSRYIKELLDSPHYGERWARHWMDVARFAESHGYEQDYDRPNAYHYRDFLIQAFNEDLPYDRFIEWQLAGDELEPENPQAMMATGFLGAGVFPTQLTEAEFESARYDELDDMVTTTGVAFLGLSVGCARCHDHKFDPIPSRDYYRMAATFTTAIRSEVLLDLDPDENRRRRQEQEGKITKLEKSIADYEQQNAQKAFSEWIEGYEDGKAEPWQVLNVLEVRSSAGSTFKSQGDGSWLATGKAPQQDELTIIAESDLDQVSRLRIEALTHGSLPRKGPGRADNGNFALGNVELSFVEIDGKNGQNVRNPEPGKADREQNIVGKSIAVELTKASATHQQNTSSLSVMASIDDDPVSGWAVDHGGIGKDQAAVFEFAETVNLKGRVRWLLRLRFHHPNHRHAMGRIRISLSNRPDAAVGVGSEDGIAHMRTALTEAKLNRDPESKAWKECLKWFVTTLPEWQKKKQQLEELRKQGDGAKLTKVMVTSEGLPHMKHHADGRGFPHFYPETHFLKRGDVQQKQEVVKAGFLQALTPADIDETRWVAKSPRTDPRTSFRRATLANWMTDVDSGAGALVARVIVNRVWQHHFGKGLVATPNDFGTSGDEPTHPELLNWLAKDFVDHGWQLKRLHHLIMTSSVYRQSAGHDERRATLDRENELLWRWQPRRLEAEAIRDSLLAVSGMLDTRMYGPGTLDPKMKRRSIYFFIKRSKLIPEMMLFDWPEHLVSIGSRSNTTVAPQALMFLNSPQGRRYAASLVSRLTGESVEENVFSAYQLAFSRSPSEVEKKNCLAFVSQQETVYRQKNLKDPRHAALLDLCQALMSTSEFIYVE